MVEQLESLTYWHWIILALLLLGGEALGAAGFMIGISISAMGVALLMALGIIVDWQIQFLLFALLSVVASIVFWKFFSVRSENDDAGMINNRAAQLVGRTLTLEHNVENGQGKLQIGDTFWKVAAQQDLKAGTLVEIHGAEGMVLLIKKV